jgi:hypothetical protein
MQLILIEFDDSVDLSAITVGATVQVGSLSGIVDSKTSMVNPPDPILLAHTHTINGTVTGVTGEPV